jgi:4-amino-4-deoxy-L-arabinose transferase-like glycosyltransferase
MARELGGGRFAQTLAMVAAIVAPVYLGTHHIFSMNAFDILFWAISAYILILILNGGDKRLWVLLGVVLGVALENKISVLWLGAGLGVGLVVTSNRRWLATPWPWLCGAIAFTLFAPYILWQMAEGWPTLEFIENATSQKMVAVSPLSFLRGQVEAMHPFTFPIWLSGLLFYLVLRKGVPFRLLGWMYVTIVVVLISAGTSRSGYLVPAYTWLLAAGGIVFEGALERVNARIWLKSAVLTLLILGGIVTSPFALPVLPVETYIGYALALGVAPGTEEKKEMGKLPQHYADMHGWPETVDLVADVYLSLPPADQEKAAILALNYGVAGAIDFFGPRYGLPPAISNHNNYWLWGPRGNDGKVVIILGGSEERISQGFESCERAATFECDYCMPYENHRPVWVCRDLKVPMEEFWTAIKNFN